MDWPNKSELLLTTQIVPPKSVKSRVSGSEWLQPLLNEVPAQVCVRNWNGWEGRLRHFSGTKGAVGPLHGRQL